MQSDDNVDIFFLGDTYFGEWHMRLRAKKGKHNVLQEKSYLHFGKNFEAILKDGDEVLINIECAITDIKTSPLEGSSKKHLYAAKEDKTIEALKKLNITTAILANNHSVDFGKAGLIDTIKALEKANIKYIGAGRDEKEASKPLFFDKKCGNEVFKVAIVSAYNYGKISDDFGFYARENIPGVNQQNLKVVTQQVKNIKEKEKDRLYIFSPHWGPNYVWRTFTQQKMSEELINGGVDIIVGHSAHMIQEVEYYKKHLIVFSIGNFLMNGDGEYSRRNLPPYSYIARLNVQNIDGELIKKMMLYPIHSDNTASCFTPRFVTQKEFEHVKCILRGHNVDMDMFDNVVTVDKDKYGFYFEYPIFN